MSNTEHHHNPWLSAKLLAWFDLHGRKDLPWQTKTSQTMPTPYRVWVSEIMLQQTQVITVIPYYQRFISSFPDIRSLAAATQDQVLHHWTGLGYYARARNLHKAAQQICQQNNGHFPSHIDDVCALPGIGRSTAGAILSLSMQQRHTILDGNVKRVLARFHAIAGWPSRKSIENLLWQHAEQHTPSHRVHHHTQAIMDLGATVCTRSKPACHRCPLSERCIARQEQITDRLPSPKPRKTLPIRTATMLLIRNNNDELLLEQRPPSGLWGGLLSFPEIPDAFHNDINAISHWANTTLHTQIIIEQQWATFRHTFSHFHLDITPVIAREKAPTASVMEQGTFIWYNDAYQSHGLAAPVKKLMDQLNKLQEA